MKANEIKSWKEFWNIYFGEENLILKDFETMWRECDPIENAETGDWPSSQEMFDLYEGDEFIQVKLDEDDGVNENDFLIVIYSPQWKYIVPVTPDFVENCLK